MPVSARTRYRLLRWTLVQLRRAAVRWHINFDNAVESSAKGESYQQRFNRGHYDPDRFTWAHRYLPERVRMWSPWWLRHVVAVERTLHERTMYELAEARF